MVFNNYILSVGIYQPVTLYNIVFVLMYVTIIYVHMCTWLVCDLNQSACNAEMKMSSIIINFEDNKFRCFRGYHYCIENLFLEILL